MLPAAVVPHAKDITPLSHDLLFYKENHYGNTAEHASGRGLFRKQQPTGKAASNSAPPLGGYRLASGPTSLRTRGNTVAVDEAIQTRRPFVMPPITTTSE
ncbi:MAG: hypothetical protein LBT00_11600 [Spirochaetaceae bacterium]|nr:hypothetical protein [Spirochaetaceae bacterium]